MSKPFAGTMIEWTWEVTDLAKAATVPTVFSGYASQADGGPTIEMDVSIKNGRPVGTFVPDRGGQWYIVLSVEQPVVVVEVDKLTVESVPRRVLAA